MNLGYSFSGLCDQAIIVNYNSRMDRGGGGGTNITGPEPSYIAHDVYIVVVTTDYRGRCLGVYIKICIKQH